MGQVIIMEKATATLRNLRIAPRKVRLACGVLKGLAVTEALAQVQVMKVRSKEPIDKLIRSAVANARNKKMNPAKLVIESIRVDGGPVLKRFRARARGTAARIEKKMSHIMVVLVEKPSLKEPRFPTIIAVTKKKKKSEGPKAAEKASAKKEIAEKKEVKKAESDKKKEKGNDVGVVRKVFRRKAI